MEVETYTFVLSCAIILAGGASAWGSLTQKLKSHQKSDDLQFKGINGELKEIKNDNKEIKDDIKELLQRTARIEGKLNGDPQ